MDVDIDGPSNPNGVSRDKTAPFLIRTFVKIGNFHRLSQFEDGILPTTDEHQLFTWKDATLREVLTTLRDVAPHVAEYRHPLARFSFRTIYADAGNKGRFSQKDLGMVYSRDILGEPGTITTTAPRLLEDFEGENSEPTDREREERTLDELRFVPGDYLLVAVLLPKSVTVPSEVKAPSNGWRAAKGDGAWGGASGPVLSASTGRGGGHWRGESNAPVGVPRGRGRGRDRDADRRVPPPRRGESPPSRVGWGKGRRSRSRSPRRGSRYD